MSTFPPPGHPPFTGRLVVLGWGSVAQAVLPLLVRDLGIAPRQVTVIHPGADDPGLARYPGLAVVRRALHPQNHAQVLEPLLEPGDFLLNLSVNVGSATLMALCLRRGALYLDACTEPWPGRVDNRQLPPAQRTNYALREEALALRRAGAPTACITQGANPGLVSFFAKQALLAMAGELRLALEPPRTRGDWAQLAQRLGVKVIHVAERDTQAAQPRKRPGEFVNTWSVDAFVEEGLQPAELGWGTHERHWPADAHAQQEGCRAAIYLDRPGFATRVRSYAPLHGPYQGFLITHAESVSLADALTVRDADGAVRYRPTVHYAYRPCEDAVLSVLEFEASGWQPPAAQRIVRDEIVSGVDELGVLLMGNARGAFWYGSQLSIEEARRLAPCNSATSLQVAAGILGAMVWALRNPRAGVVEAEDMDLETVMAVASPYLGPLVGAWTDWTPLANRRLLFDEAVDAADPWQFVNFRVG